MALLMNHFAERDRSHHAERLRQHKWFIKAREDHQKQKEQADARAEDLVDLAANVVIANDAELKAFRAKLDTYDEATVRALELNQQQIDELTSQLAEVRARLQKKLDQAYVMPDGRRVFKTEDGTQVFDEHGAEVTPDELDFDLIPEGTFSWESYKGDLDLKTDLEASLNDLEQERSDILDYQEKLDNARERTEADNFSQDELDALDAELEALMPDAVAKQMPGYQPVEPSLQVSSAFKAHADPESIRIGRNVSPGLQPDVM